MNRPKINHQPKQDKLVQHFPLFKLLPNVVTLIALCVALSALNAALSGHFVRATTFVLIAGFLDGVDGRLARFLNSTSDFGAQLDSLSDFVSFGIVPGLVVYLWINQYENIRGIDWAMVLFFAICMAIRLARFNVDIGKKTDNPVLSNYFFRGIPAPCGAALAMLPMVLSYQFGYDYFFTNAVYVIAYIFILAVLLASTLPTISIKKIPVRNDYASITLMILGLIIIGLLIEPWITLAVIGILYLASIPLTISTYFKIKYSVKQ